jgi:hypothetical protein
MYRKAACFDVNSIRVTSALTGRAVEIRLNKQNTSQFARFDGAAWEFSIGDSGWFRAFFDHDTPHQNGHDGPATFSPVHRLSRRPSHSIQ